MSDPLHHLDWREGWDRPDEAMIEPPPEEIPIAEVVEVPEPVPADATPEASDPPPEPEVPRGPDDPDAA